MGKQTVGSRVGRRLGTKSKIRKHCQNATQGIVRRAKRGNGTGTIIKSK